MSLLATIATQAAEHAEHGHDEGTFQAAWEIFSSPAHFLAEWAWEIITTILGVLLVRPLIRRHDRIHHGQPQSPPCDHLWRTLGRTYTPGVANVEGAYTAAQMRWLTSGFTTVTLECSKCGLPDHITTEGDARLPRDPGSDA